MFSCPACNFPISTKDFLLRNDRTPSSTEGEDESSYLICRSCGARLNARGRFIHAVVQMGLPLVWMETQWNWLLYPIAALAVLAGHLATGKVTLRVHWPI